jgi:thioredoxin 1
VPNTLTTVITADAVVSTMSEKTRDTADAEELDAIRRRKRQALESRLGDEEAATAENGEASPSEPVPVDGASAFDSLVADGGVLLVDFHAEWCGPCKMLEPTVERIAAETNATVAKVDVDRNQELAARYGVRGVPTLLLFGGGEVVERVVGVRDAETLRELVERYA